MTSNETYDHAALAARTGDEIAGLEFSIRTGWDGTPGTEACELLRRASYLLSVEAKLTRIEELLSANDYARIDGHGAHLVYDRTRDHLQGGDYEIKRHDSGYGSLPQWHVRIKAYTGEALKLERTLADSGLLDGWDCRDDGGIEEAYYIGGPVSVQSVDNSE